MNSTECPFLFVLSYLGAKIRIFPQTAKDLREKFYCLALAMIASGIPTVYSTPSILRSASMWL